MLRIDLSARELARRVLALNRSRRVCVLDGCGAGLNGRFMFVGIDPLARHDLNGAPADILAAFDELITGGAAAIFTVSYDFGKRLLIGNGGGSMTNREPDIWLTLFDALAVHDYAAGATFLTGADRRISVLADDLSRATPVGPKVILPAELSASSNFSKAEYVRSVETIREHIRAGATYQTNLTQQIRLALPDEFSVEAAFLRLRESHPAPFAAIMRRDDSDVVSISPENFFKVERPPAELGGATITASPIKGTRPRGHNPADDQRLRTELETSAKDRAENTMIVDLLRNDLGRVCDYGTVSVRRLCEVETYATMFHLVSEIAGKLRARTKPSQIIAALFPCGSITGAPKISTMRIIEKLEPQARGLSMGAIGCSIPRGFDGIDPIFEASVAIRTVVRRGREAIFNVGGGVTIDSRADAEYDESLLKAQAILAAFGARLSPKTF